MKKIYITLPVQERHKQYLQTQLGSAKDQYKLIYKPEEEISTEEMRQADALIGVFSPARLKEAENLNWLQSGYAGVDNLVQPGVVRPEAVICSATGAYGLAVSEHLLAMTLGLMRRIGQYSRNQGRHIWKVLGHVDAIEKSVFLILGVGDIGGRYARMVRALGAARVIGVRKTNRSKPDFLDEQYTLDELDEQLPRADVVVMILPGGPATRHLIDERRLRLMKPDAYLLNDGRGSAIDPQGLKNVLREGRLAGVGLDVTEPEPLPKDDELWDYDRVMITPHCAGKFNLDQTVDNVVQIAGRNLAAYVQNGELINVIDRSKGY